MVGHMLGFWREGGMVGDMLGFGREFRKKIHNILEKKTIDFNL